MEVFVLFKEMAHELKVIWIFTPFVLSMNIILFKHDYENGMFFKKKKKVLYKLGKREMNKNSEFVLTCCRALAVLADPQVSLHNLMFCSVFLFN